MPSSIARLYVESDARAVAILLKRNPQLRSALVNILVYAKARRLKKMRLRCVNRRLWLEFLPKVEHDLFAAKTYLAPLLPGAHSSAYYRMEGSRSAAIYVRPGVLGFDWVEKIEPTW